MKQKKSQTKLVLIALLAILSLFLITGCNSELLSLTPEDEEVNEEPVAENVFVEETLFPREEIIWHSPRIWLKFVISKSFLSKIL